MRAHLALVALLGTCAALRAPVSVFSGASRRSGLVRRASSAAPTEAAAAAAAPATIPVDRYVAMNRFSLRDGKAAAFEKRWATRKSRLSELPGFRYFQLMRRVPMSLDGDDACANDPHDYVSFTIWEDKEAFDLWRNGDAFKEAHGGTSIGAFLSTMVNSLRTLKGAPAPVFYDGLLHLAAPAADVRTGTVVDGWREVDADGVTLLPAESFTACNRFTVKPGMAAGFEARWAARESKLAELPGFRSFTMLRRDAGNTFGSHGGKKDDDGAEVDAAVASSKDHTHMSATVWKDRASFDGWRSSQQFGASHGDGKARPAGKPEQAGKPEAGKGGGGPPPMWDGAPSPVAYEAVMTLVCDDGP